MNSTEYTYRLWIDGRQLGNVYARLAHIARVIEHIGNGGDGRGGVYTVCVDIKTCRRHDSVETWANIPGIVGHAYLPSLDEIFAEA